MLWGFDVNTIRIGTRDSALARWQTQWVVNELKKLKPDFEYEVVAIKTIGDKILDVSLSKIGDKGLFTKELEVSLLEGRIDIAVHSLKDLPTELPKGCLIGAICRRAEPGDVLISREGLTLKDLPPGARIGTSSLRRRSQILNFRPDLNILDIRGNLTTRIKKMEQEKLDAIILAAAGVERLELRKMISEYISYNICLPAVGQGAIALEVRSQDYPIMDLIQIIHDEVSAISTLAERAFLRRLEGGCQIPIAALGQVSNRKLVLEGRIASLDGVKMVKGSQNIQWPESKPEKFTGKWPYQSKVEQLGKELAENLLDQGGREILETINCTARNN